MKEYFQYCGKCGNEIDIDDEGCAYCETGYSNYPKEDDIKKIISWKISSFQDLIDIMSFVHSLWWMPESLWIVKKENKEYEIHTGGWSGNEELISALKKNTLFWIQCWYSSVRGGHYIFKIPNKKE